MIHVESQVKFKTNTQGARTNQTRHTYSFTNNDGPRLVLLLWLAYVPSNCHCSIPPFHRLVPAIPPSCASANGDIIITDSGEAFNVGRFLEESSPYAWGATGIGLCIGLSVLGAGWCVSMSSKETMNVHVLICAGEYSSLAPPS
jgi:hypothetical protein